jgi:hypothetical protein
MHPHGAYMRQLLVQRKMLKLKDPTAALLAKSRQWRDTDKFRQPESRGRMLEAYLQATLNMIPAYAWYAAPPVNWRS